MSPPSTGCWPASRTARQRRGHRIAAVRRAGCALVLAGAMLPVAAVDAVPPAVAAMLRGSGLPLRSFGIEVRAVDDDEAASRVSLNADAPFLMASTAKLVTSLAALDLLGAQHRWRTEAHATGPVTQGRLQGDLVIRGGPVGLTTGALRRWFTQMRAEGVRAVTGDIVLAGVAFLHDREPRQAQTTAKELMPESAPEARLYNQGKLLVSVQPGARGRATVIVRPQPGGMVVVNDVFMGGGCAAWARWKTADEAKGGARWQLWVRGRWDAGCAKEDIAFVSPPDDAGPAPQPDAAKPEPIAATTLVDALWRDSGGSIGGQVVETPPTEATRKGAAAPRWRSEVATPLTEVMREMNKTSNNAAAHSLLLALTDGAPRRGPALPSAVARVEAWLRTQGLADGDIRIEEGSGRSRAERAKPAAMVALLRKAWRGSASQAFVDSLPIAGVDGTLAHRMRSGAAHGQAYLKTGTLSDTRALAGYVRAKSGKVYAVSIMVNHAHAARATATLDALIEWTAQHG